ncbi:MAG: hypothetical protein KTR35_16800 [Gammaproteobacteria bacterium]|nr:hypothetical protein [Gammaproteobacteria bacterium]
MSNRKVFDLCAISAQPKSINYHPFSAGFITHLLQLDKTLTRFVSNCSSQLGQIGKPPTAQGFRYIGAMFLILLTIHSHPLPAEIKSNNASSKPIPNALLVNLQKHSEDTISLKRGSNQHISFHRAKESIMRVLTINWSPHNAIYQAFSAAHGQLTEHVNRYFWRSPDGWLYQFNGSFPISATAPDGLEYLWNYKTNQIVTKSSRQPRIWSIPMDRRIFCAYGEHNFNALNLEHTDTPSDQPKDPLTPEQLLELFNTDSDSSSEETGLCDTEANPPPANFTDLTPIPNSIPLDIRPASCESYFTQFSNIQRGQQIEIGFGLHEYHSDALATVQNFPVIDFIEGTTAIALISRDLGSASYNDASNTALYEQLIEDGEKIFDDFLEPLRTEGSVSSTSGGDSTTIEADTVQETVLELVVQAGSASDAQIAQIEQASETLAANWGIIIRVIEIP